MMFAGGESLDFRYSTPIFSELDPVGSALNVKSCQGA